MVYGQFPSSIPFIRLDLHSLLVQPENAERAEKRNVIRDLPNLRTQFLDVFHRFFSFAFSALLSVQIVANRDDFRSAEFIPPERELRQHALDNSPTLFVDQPSCGLKSALLWLRLRRAVFFAVHSSWAIEGCSTGKSVE